MFKFAVTGIDISLAKQQAALCGENFIKFIDLGSWAELHDDKVRR